MSGGGWIHPRGSWTTTPHTAELDVKNRKTLYVHITESPAKFINTEAERIAALRATRDFHVKVRGWADIGYNYLCFQPWSQAGPADVYVGRGAQRIPASQQGANAGNWAVSVFGMTEDYPMGRTLEAIARLAKHLEARKILGHRDQNNTDCPGDKFYSKLPEIRRLAGL